MSYDLKKKKDKAFLKNVLFFCMLTVFNSNRMWSQPSGPEGMSSVEACKSYYAFLSDHWSCMESFPLRCQKEACHCQCQSLIRITQEILHKTKQKFQSRVVPLEHPKMSLYSRGRIGLFLPF